MNDEFTESRSILGSIFEQTGTFSVQFTRPIRYTVIGICLILIAIYIIKYILYKMSIKNSNVENQEASNGSKKVYNEPSIGYIIGAVVLYFSMKAIPWVF